MEDLLRVSLFEIPTLPPSLPGLRLERALQRLAIEAGAELVEGPVVRGEVDGRSAGKRVSGVVATTAAGPRPFRSRAVLLATGGALHGGWMSFAGGEIQESVFGLPWKRRKTGNNGRLRRRSKASLSLALASG
jgi:glycerol-3-phosphate dehydrogenase subunit B